MAVAPNVNAPLPKQVLELEAVLQQLIDEHRKLLKHIDANQAAMKALNVKAIDETTQLQEAARLRIATAEQKRRALTQVLAKHMRVAGEPKVSQLAELYPQRRVQLLKLRNELMTVLKQVGERTFITSRLAGAVLGHLNTAMRLFAGAVRHAGLYTRSGSPQMGRRVGMMDAVG